MKIAVSACLLGRNCKYNGGNNRSQAVLDFLEGHVVIPVCPEVTGGLPVPRVPVELQNGRAVNKNGEDVTAYFRRGVEQTMARPFGRGNRPCHPTAAPVPPADAERFTTVPFPEKRYPARGCLPKPLRMQGFR